MFSLCDIDEIFEKIGNSTVGSQPAEWSEEDERMLESIIWHIRNSVNLGDIEHTAGQLEDWLKSLRPRLHWKLSEAQTNCLMRVITWLTEAGNFVDSGILADLKKQLETR